MTEPNKRSIRIPPGEGRAVTLRVGSRFAVVDLQGGQVGDLFAFASQDTFEFASASHTRSILGRLFPRPGEAIYANLRRPILLLEQDTSPGRHDTLYAACDPRRYEMLGVSGPHRSCSINLEEAMVDYGGLKVPTPQPFNLFMDVALDAEGVTEVRTATSQPGDRLVFRTLGEVVVVLSSCPMDVYDISSGGITSLGIKLL